MAAKEKNNIPASILLPRWGFRAVSLALLLFGLVVAYSASSITAIAANASSFTYLESQCRYAFMGIVAIAILWVIPIGAWNGKAGWVIWAIAVILIIITAVFGVTDYGAQRWLEIGPIKFQPAELFKPALCIALASLLSSWKSGEYSTWQVLAMGIIVIGIPIGLLFATQSDLGTTIICGVCILAALLYAGVPVRYIICLVALLGVAAIIAIVGTGYRSDRFVYIDPYNDGEGGYGDGYQTIRSWYAFADGGLFGVGLGNSREKYLYLPAINTDYVFAAIGEELGLVGCMAVILLFVAFLYFGLRIAREAANDFSSILAGTLTTIIVFQAFLNIGCGISLFPMTGKPLPFISVGGTSLISTLIMVGLILAVSKETGEEHNFASKRADLRVLQRVDNNAYASHDTINATRNASHGAEWNAERATAHNIAQTPRAGISPRGGVRATRERR
jgi:cell division protein FtsW